MYGIGTGRLPRLLAYLTVAGGALYVHEAVVPSVATVFVVIHTVLSAWLGIVLYRMPADATARETS